MFKFMQWNGKNEKEIAEFFNVKTNLDVIEMSLTINNIDHLQGFWVAYHNDYIIQNNEDDEEMTYIILTERHFNFLKNKFNAVIYQLQEEQDEVERLRNEMKKLNTQRLNKDNITEHYKELIRDLAKQNMENDIRIEMCKSFLIDLEG